MFCNLLITASLGSALLVYRARQKTYAGFTFWTAGTLALALGCLVLILRGPAASWTNIVLADGGFAVGSLLRLDGILRFKGWKCKKIRDTQGSWHQVEAYIKERSDVHFTHGLCPECIRETMPKDVADKVLGENGSA